MSALLLVLVGLAVAFYWLLWRLLVAAFQLARWAYRRVQEP